MGKRRAREIWEYDSMAEFEADGGAAGYGSGQVLIGGQIYFSDGVNIDAAGGGSGVSAAITGSFVENQTISLTLSSGWSASGYQWLRNGTPISGATSSTYVLTSADVGSLVTCRVSGLTYTLESGQIVAVDDNQVDPPAGVIVGGVEINSAGAPGTIYDGYTLSWGDEFDTLDILAAHRPRGKWIPTRTYLPGARGSDTLLGTMFDTDPFFTGHNDSNRGVPVGYGNMSVNSSVINLQSRVATPAEKAHFQGNRNEVAAMISGAALVHWFPDAANTSDIIFEGRIRFTTGNPTGWHPTLWLMSLNPVITFDSDEIDWEGNSLSAHFNRNVWTAGAQAGQTAGSSYPHDNQFHVVTFIINKTNVRLFLDGTLYATGAWNGNSKNKPQYPLLTSHIFNGTFEGDPYSQASWNNDANGATLSADWMRVWRRTGKNHYTPLVSLADQNVNFNSSITITIPSAVTVWGDASVTEYLQAIYVEENEPGVTHSAVYTQFPPGVTYNAGTRQLTVNLTSGKTGRINFVLSAWKPDGSTGEPLRFAVNVGPVINISNLSFTAGDVVNFDVYAACDCGVLTTNGVSKTKIIAITGLSGSGLTYNDTTGLLTGVAVNGSFNLNITCTNSVGQSASKSVNLSIALSGPAYHSWTGPAWFDASDTTSVVSSGGTLESVSNKRYGGDGLLASGETIQYVPNVQNNRSVFRFARHATQNMSRLYPSLAVASPISAVFQGNDKAFTCISVYIPTDTNTGYIWSASDTVDAVDAQTIALVRRNATASSVRRGLTTAVANDVNFGSGQVSGVARIVAVKHTGTAVTVWDNSITPAVSSAAQDTTTFNSELVFRIGASEGAGPSDPTFNTGPVCAQDFCELILESTARSDAEIQQAITDLADKWGINLS